MQLERLAELKGVCNLTLAKANASHRLALQYCTGDRHGWL